MPGTSLNHSAPLRVLPIVMPVLAAPFPGEWHGRGLCAGEDPEIFFPCDGDPGTRARQICAACAVRDDCLGYATDADEFGVWGGLDQGERRELLRSVP
jgi:WhiB family redox-sensing transcriptional regulator